MVNDTKPVNRQRPVPVPVKRASDMGVPEFPYSQEAEEAVIGGILIDEQVYYKLATYLTANSFFFPRHVYIWEAMDALVDAGSAIDTLTIGDKLKAMRRFDDVGRDAYLTHLLTHIPTSHNVEAYAKIVQSHAARRMLLQLADETKRMAMDSSIDITQLIANVSEAVDKTAGQLMTPDIAPIGNYLNGLLDRIESATKANTHAQLIPTGLLALDAIIGGYQRGKVTVVAGRTHNGKTTLAYTSVIASAKMGKSVALYNTADGDIDSVMMSLLSVESGVSTLAMKTGVTPQQYQAIVGAAGRLAKLKIFIKSDKELTPRGLYLHARAVQFVHGLDIIFVDYIQAMKTTPNHTDYERHCYIAQALDTIANKLNVAMVEMAQINRNGAKKALPGLEDIEGCGKYEQYAETGMIAYNESLYKPDADPNKMAFIVQKNRVTGRTGTALAHKNADTTALTEWHGE